MTLNMSGALRTFDEEQSQRPESNLSGFKATIAVMESEDQALPTADAGNTETGPRAVNAMTHTSDDDLKNKMSRLLKGKEREWSSVREKKGPLHLLDMPTEILYGVIKEVTHTNDLTSLARTCSALHNLTVPQIYSRFDIVWPDTHATADPRTGVDALTYGLATLVMGEDVFGGTSSPRTPLADRAFPGLESQCDDTQGRFEEYQGPTKAISPSVARKRRRGNNFARYTRKFSLGNGPPDWVSEYMITKEGGKMLGTLVALAVARMSRLEVFVWDMPTGVLRDVWLALSSLADGRDGQDCHLERVWIRWHDNSDSLGGGASANPTAVPPPPPLPSSLLITPVGMLLPPNGAGTGTPAAAMSNLNSSAHSPMDRVEYPTFSVLPPLKSLSVLDIDELLYLDEMSILVERSQDCLRELRVGIARQAIHKEWAMSWDGPGLQQVDHSVSATTDSTIGEKRLGGILGILLGRVYDIHKKQAQTRASEKAKTSAEATVISDLEIPSQVAPVTTTSAESSEAQAEMILSSEESVPALHNAPQSSSLHHTESITGLFATSQLDVQPDNALAIPVVSESLGSEQAQGSSASNTASALNTSQHLTTLATAGSETLKLPKLASRALALTEVGNDYGRKPLTGKLRLETLELERVQISVSVMQRAFDWSLLTSLTLLRCENHEQLWKTLRKSFAPRPFHTSFISSSRSKYDSTVQHPGGSTKPRKLVAPTECEYQLNLKKVHTDAVSPSLISFLRDTLAPNSLEVLFLKDNTPYLSTVTLKQIYRGPLRRHKASLKKLMVDSCERLVSTDQPAPSPRGRRWMFNREVLAFVTSGKMCKLTELGMVLEYKDWHYFLQRLPLIHHLRSLYIPYLADHVHAANLDVALDPKELALQIVDIVALRPEVEVCYMGILAKCFEILERKQTDERHGAHDGGSSPAHAGPGGVMTDGAGEDEDEDEDEELDDDDGGVDDDPDDDDADPSDSDETISEPKDDSDDDESFADDDEKLRIMPRLREILFYDDKVAIFKARHGRL